MEPTRPILLLLNDDKVNLFDTAIGVGETVGGLVRMSLAAGQSSETYEEFCLFDCGLGRLNPNSTLGEIPRPGIVIAVRSGEDDAERATIARAQVQMSARPDVTEKEEYTDGPKGESGPLHNEFISHSTFYTRPLAAV